MSNPLTDVLPAKVRRWIYAIVFLVGLILAVWTASDGDWLKFVAALAVALQSAMAGSNTSTDG